MIGFNEKQYETYISFVGDDRMAIVLNEFYAAMDHQLQTLKQPGISAETKKQIFHAISSMAGNLGFETVQKDCQQLETLVEDLDEDEYLFNINHLESVYFSLKKYITSIR